MDKKTNSALQKELAEKILGELRQSTNVNRHALAQQLGVPQDHVFGVAFTAARDTLVAEGVDIRPTGEGNYEAADPKQMVKRAQRYVRKGKRAITRGGARAALAAVQAEDTKVSAQAKRLAERAEYLSSRAASSPPKSDPFRNLGDSKPRKSRNKLSS